MELPSRVVALGGGTGLPLVLRGLREVLGASGRDTITAVVTMSDDGGSSGRLRRSRGLPPPGDVRNCLVALSEAEDLLAGLFQHRYEGVAELGGHSLGNLILAALAEQTGSFLKAVEVSSEVLRTTGRILPATLDEVILEAEIAGGFDIIGESAIGECPKPIRRVRLNPSSARATPGVLDAIVASDLIVLGPGSLFTSILPNLLIDGMVDAIRASSAPCVLVGNLVSEHGEAAGLGLTDHLDIIHRHVGGTIVDILLCHDGEIDPSTRERYREEGAVPLAAPESDHDGVQIVRRMLASATRKLRHDSCCTAEGLLDAWRALRNPREWGQTNE
ncbi:MAG: uridine diphosphate-N-acetylglucosamine-binding protein YvcK [Acidobacteriota bacterium]|nr:uridine diphosphate-N-acetylglucosamine-binding protein YvcK [Acidobacteriota bacterium]MDH3784148.1 uridine diphosphate-N-acetylglucosamine-binding protein YvcK [Acidobacteriota bacterium]